MSEPINLSEYRQRKRFPELRLVHSRPPEVDRLLEQARRFARIIAEMKPSDSEPEPAA